MKTYARQMAAEVFNKGQPPTKEWVHFIVCQVIDRCAHEADRFVAARAGIPNTIAANIRKLAKPRSPQKNRRPR